MSANNGRSSIFAKNIAIMAPNAFCRYPDGRNTLVDIISACDNARLPVGPFSSDWKHARDEQNSKLTRPTTPLDLAIPFFVRPPAAGGESQDQPIGFLRPDVAQAMKEYNSQQGDQPIFDFLGDKEDPWGVAFTQALNDPDAEHAFALRTRAMNRMVEIWRDDGKFPENLKGWRNERYAVYGPQIEDSDAPESVAFFLERSATACFGMATFGSHLNGYFIDKTTHEYHLWISRRSKTKQTWPDCLDNTVGGGITEMDAPLDTIIRECGEEAGLSATFVQKNLWPSGLVSYVRKDKLDYLFPEYIYVYDLKFPGDHSVVPKPNDDEVDHFECLTANQVVDEMVAGNFKPNCALVLIDFFVRHGLITSETDCRFNEICRRMHREILMPGPG